MAWFLDERPDFAQHNAEVAAVWEAYRAGQPTRVPVSVLGSIRGLFQNPAINTTGYTFEQFFHDPEAQIQCQLAYQRWCRSNLLCDQEMGPPPQGWELRIDFQNSHDAGWFGCPMHFDGNETPDTRPILEVEKLKLYDLAPPDPLCGGLMARAMEFYEYMRERCPQIEFEGLPVHPPRGLPGEGTDGVFQAAVKLRGGTGLCLDMLTDPGYAHDLMGFVTECLIDRIKACRRWRWEQYPDSPDKDDFHRAPCGIADDAIVLLSIELYREFVLPYHRRIVEEFGDGGRISAHLCGDASRFFPVLRDELNVYCFDTGFPIDHGLLRRELGPEVEIFGGPNVMLLQEGPPEAIRCEVERICNSGILEGGRFVMIAANNLAPRTPVEHVTALYEAAKSFGRYPAAV